MRALVQWIFNRPYLLLFLTALFWSGNAIVGRAVIDTMPPIGLAFWRWFLAFLIVLPFAIRPLMADAQVLKAYWLRIVVLGLLGISTFNACLYIGLHSTQAINSGVLQSVMPMLIVGMTALLGERPTARQLVGIVVALVGVFVMLFRADPALMAAFSFNPGDVWILAGVVVYAVYSVGLRWRPQLNPLSFVAATFAVGWLSMLPLYITETMNGDPVTLLPINLAAIGYVAIFPSLVAYLCFNRGVELLGASRAGITLYLVPMIVSLLAILLLGEPFHLYHAAGMALILGGVGFAESRRKDQQ
ncbi:MAG: DMT family transporter [Parvibaculum sp.]|uniref:DMT family transporter n=1 Tax=Parvibaculum sp. TaxID=2024848 RepID=UPI003C7952A4